MSKDTRSRIIESAKRVVLEQGLDHFTLVDVADAAGVSKGGLLYHFPSKEALVRGMLNDTLSTFSDRMHAHAEQDAKPGRWIRAYVRATFPPARKNDRPDVAAAAVVAGIATDRTLLQAYAEEAQKWTALLAGDDVDPLTVAVVRMAADGLWLNEALGLSPLSPDGREEFLKRLVDMTGAVGAAKKPARPRVPASA